LNSRAIKPNRSLFEGISAASLPLGDGRGETHVHSAFFDAGGKIGEHPTGFAQLFAIKRLRRCKIQVSRFKVAHSATMALLYGFDSFQKRGAVRLGNPSTRPQGWSLITLPHDLIFCLKGTTGAMASSAVRERAAPGRLKAGGPR